MLIDDDKIKTELEVFLGREPENNEVAFVVLALEMGDEFLVRNAEHANEINAFVDMCRVFRIGIA